MRLSLLLFILFSSLGNILSFENTKISVVELSYFDVNQKDSIVQIDWGTDSEINNKGFLLQRREINNNEIQYNDIAYIQGAMNSIKSKKYQFLDSLIILGNTYNYRIVAEELDGSLYYSNVVEITTGDIKTFINNKDEGNHIVLNPNSIEISYQKRTHEDFKIISVNGAFQNVKIHKINELTFIIDISDLYYGNYLLLNNKNCIFKFIK